jgi:hypothetical protein
MANRRKRADEELNHGRSLRRNAKSEEGNLRRILQARKVAIATLKSRKSTKNRAGWRLVL